MRSDGTFVDFRIAASYRIPRPVVAVRRYSTSKWVTAYPVCPRCHLTMPREYQSFCDRCGQRLDWSDFGNAEVIR